MEIPSAEKTIRVTWKEIAIVLLWVISAAAQWGIFTQRMNGIEASIADMKAQMNQVQQILMERK